MMLSRALFAFLVTTSLLIGPGAHYVSAADDSPKDQPTEAKQEEKKDEKSSSKEHDKKKEHRDKHDHDKKDGDHKKKPSKEQDKPKNNPKQDKESKKDAPKSDDSKKDDSKKDDSKKDDSKKDEPKKDEPKKDEPKKDEPKKDEPKKEMKPEVKAEPKKDADKKDEGKPEGEPTPAKTPEPKAEMKSEAAPDKPADKKPEEKKPEPKPEVNPLPKPAPKPDPRKMAITELSKVDGDFAFQGEYYGKIHLPGGISESAGLQIIARGDGNFVGRQLRGGLPGNGWYNDQKIDLTGKRAGDVLILTQGDYQVVVTNQKATIVNSAGDTLGVLTKVQRRSELLGLKPSSSAVVLFDGNSVEQFVNAKINDKGELQIGTETKNPVQDFRMHLEFRLPYMPFATGQGRANSGLYIQGRYEVQILDSFGLPGEFNECGSLYRTKSPDINMCFPPLSWQTYDVYFTAARFDSEGNKIIPARITVQHNGILVQDNYLIPNKTGAGKPEGPEPQTIKLQDHGNPVVFRNIWIEYLGGPVVSSTPEAETLPTPAKK
ncbi:3-keto-disaccharide hydrolase [Bremerella cremea]|uniref:3-keto-disaccharide hydrolase n=2 Tax=Bremerella cremea TaxID=1031537 RepID=UPI0031E5FBA9